MLTKEEPASNIINLEEILAPSKVRSILIIMFKKKIKYTRLEKKKSYNFKGDEKLT